MVKHLYNCFLPPDARPVLPINIHEIAVHHVYTSVYIFRRLALGIQAHGAKLKALGSQLQALDFQKHAWAMCSVFRKLVMGSRLQELGSNDKRLAPKYKRCALNCYLWILSYIHIRSLALY